MDEDHGFFSEEEISNQVFLKACLKKEGVLGPEKEIIAQLLFFINTGES